MKRILVVTSFFIILPAYSACAVDGLTESCSIADVTNFPATGIDRGFKTDVGVPLKGTKIPEVGKRDDSDEAKEFRLRMEEREAKSYNRENQLRNYRQDRSDFSYNASCQFGICTQTGTPQLFQQRGR